MVIILTLGLSDFSLAQKHQNNFEFVSNEEVNDTFPIAQITNCSFSIHSSAVPSNCLQNGSIRVFLSNGSSPYNFIWSNGSTANYNGNWSYNQLGFIPGIYTVTVTDNNGCTVSLTDTVHQGLGISATNNVCSGDSSGSAEVMGNSFGINFLWSNGQTTINITGLPAGLYSVTASNNSGCVETASVTILDGIPYSLQTQITNVSCYGYNNGELNVTSSEISLYFWSTGQVGNPIRNLPAGQYSVTVVRSNGCSEIGVYSVTEPDSLTISANISGLCNYDSTAIITSTVIADGGTLPYSYLWSNADTSNFIQCSLGSNYSVSVTDSQGCSGTDSINVGTLVSNLLITSNIIDVSSAGLNDGIIDITESGGIAPVSFLWSNGHSTEDINNLNAGLYAVTITDALGCEITDSFTVGVVGQKANFLNVTLSPNPSDDYVLVSIDMDVKTTVKIRIINLGGQILQTEKFENVIKLQHTLNVSELPKSVYFLEVSADGIKKIERLLVNGKQ